MKMIGGPLNGQEAPGPIQANRPDFVEIQRINGDGSVTIMCYIKQLWFVAPGKPMITFYGIVGVDIDELIEMGKKVMRDIV